MSTLTLQALREANQARQQEWNPGSQTSLSFTSNELAGEVGEACNVVKKLERERLGLRGSRATVGDLAAELADVIICADLLAMQVGVDLGEAVVAKFNATSEKVGLTTRLGDRPKGSLRVYVASKFTNYLAVREAQQRIREAGHVVTYDWTTHAEQSDPDPVACALADAEGVRSADVLVLLEVPEMRGAYVELGMALALGKPCLALPDPAQPAPYQVFEHLPGFERHATLGAVCMRLGELAGLAPRAA
jgi:NTP pyrophosphatase (non-canonical NTP hydrolase)